MQNERQAQFGDHSSVPSTDAHAIVGSSAAVMALHRQIVRTGSCDAKVLITGESGVGKELVASRIHACSRRAAGPFVAINCAGVPETLIESELFGHMRGSFTDAHRDQRGKLETADTGTLFLDEIEGMTPRMQGLLLRFLENGEVQKIGADHFGRRVDVRVLAASNCDVTRLVADGLFREDLYYRLNVIHIHVPPLRERREDIPELIEQFLAGIERASGRRVRLSPETIARLQSYDWPGNVRQLENMVLRLALDGQDTADDALSASDDFGNSPRAVPAEPFVERRRTVADALYEQLTHQQRNFWTTVYPLFMQRQITRQDMRHLVRKGLEEARGSYRTVTRLFNIPPGEYKKFLDFLRKHDCRLPYREFR